MSDHQLLHSLDGGGAHNEENYLRNTEKLTRNNLNISGENEKEIASNYRKSRGKRISNNFVIRCLVYLLIYKS